MTGPVRPLDASDAESGPVSCGSPEVDAVLHTLAVIDSLPLGEQVGQYTQAHRALADTLRAIDET
ncbi:MAG: hypothetical protein HKP61_23775 [Dactylosporangium sp.]|nr:hypothetical protein [Dactylosporangium sp.]NNJ63900.1 hypothetical protein [Dactylosporangium sp.]